MADDTFSADLFDDDIPMDELTEFMDITDEDIMNADGDDEILDDRGDDIPEEK
jgi:hypothetical protein